MNKSIIHIVYILLIIVCALFIKRLYLKNESNLIVLNSLKNELEYTKLLALKTISEIFKEHPPTKTETIDAKSTSLLIAMVMSKNDCSSCFDLGVQTLKDMKTKFEGNFLIITDHEKKFIKALSGELKKDSIGIKSDSKLVEAIYKLNGNTPMYILLINNKPVKISYNLGFLM